jgi:hypothetical protein
MPAMQSGSMGFSAVSHHLSASRRKPPAVDHALSVINHKLAAMNYRPQAPPHLPCLRNINAKTMKRTNGLATESS